MPIFDGVTESLLFVVERSNKNENLQQRNLFNKYIEKIEVRLLVFELRKVEITQFGTKSAAKIVIPRNWPVVR